MPGRLLASRAAWWVMGARVRRRLQKGRLTDMTKERNELTPSRGRQTGGEAADMAKRRRAGWHTHQEHEADDPDRSFLLCCFLPSELRPIHHGGRPTPASHAPRPSWSAHAHLHHTRRRR
jgi:hypothetical protein